MYTASCTYLVDDNMILIHMCAYKYVRFDLYEVVRWSFRKIRTSVFQFVCVWDILLFNCSGMNRLKFSSIYSNINNDEACS